MFELLVLEKVEFRGKRVWQITELLYLVFEMD